MDLSFKKMKMEHLPQVMAIERVSFPTPWSESSFVFELTHNGIAHYIVALNNGKVIGYSGMWVVLDEAHITNIAVHPDFRSHKVGQALLRELIKKAIFWGVNQMTLEVRASNKIARHLYKKFGFVKRGIRKKYYSDTDEDAIIMWKNSLSKRGENGF